MTGFGRVRLLGHDVRVAVRPGTTPGPPLVLCNGIGASLDLLEPFVNEVDPRIEVVRFDVPGVGGSPAPKVPYNFAMLAWLVGTLVDRLGYHRFDTLGISWGGGLAQQLAFQYPRRCRRLVLVSTGTGMLMVPARLSVLSKMVTPRRYRDPTYATAIAPQMYGGRMRQRPDEVRRVMYERERLEPRAGYFLQLLAGVGWTSLPALPLIRQSTLILAGRADPIIPLANARIMHALLPNASLHVFDDGHLGLLTSANELGPLVSHFLTAPSGEDPRGAAIDWSLDHPPHN
ncbi:poly(3-hydroxyalkanoate) depolymerase [Angustibacter sp. McL0619]|uniref:poly(3-hydroxyalkanoate) depolymerase n=1 Tax=Angustibacter sp. McL0619 TaxID=3415676 RepID=UPI003CF85DB6